MLVSDGSMDDTRAAGSAELGTRVVHPDEFEVPGADMTNAPKL
jgi:hypothetical protein